MTSDERKKLQEFVQSLAEMPWLSHTGEPCPDALVVSSIAEGWDDWNDQMMTVWRPRSAALEEIARTVMGEPGIDEVFADVAGVAGPGIEVALGRHFDRHPNSSDSDLGLWPDVLETMKRDIAWAAVEAVLGRPGFFSSILPYYRRGRWPCAWSGEYPEGRIVVL
jgi:hypothetical protein